MGESAVVKYYIKKDVKEEKARALAVNYKDMFDATMEAFALVLDVVGKVEYSYTTKTGNVVHVVMDSP